MATSYSNFGGQGDRRTYIGVSSNSAADSQVTNSFDWNTCIDGETGSSPYFGLGSVVGTYLRFDFMSEPRCIDEVTITKQSSSNGETFDWQGSNDGINWTTLASFNMDGTSVVISYTNVTKYQSYRMFGTSGSSASPNIQKVEFKIDGDVSSSYFNQIATKTWSSSNSTTINITTTVDSVLVLAVHVEKNSTPHTVSTVTDSQGNTWTKRSDHQFNTSSTDNSVEFWSTRAATPAAITVTVTLTAATDDASATLIAFERLPDPDNPWKSGFTALTSDVGSSAATPSMSGLTFTGAGFALVFGATCRNSIVNADFGYNRDGMHRSAVSNTGGTNFSIHRLSILPLANASSFSMVWRGTTSNWTAILDVLDLGSGPVDNNPDTCFGVVIT